ncbi:hypothetical protein EhV385 [Emiliania huxleyi virus 86]|uniref:Uncharacterized protein n=1 Tax=Emiliania huxleyi virus 86 (isolate United Kingdom/English Channel/1999) TaxID=654925 RepID=Q4A294_EHV8U|nr:hypothetical protein EhV385 [Emiliania huxleyi virus 86]AHA54997.1 hypothetical protein EhV145_00448 [Emiliania huxleyi virus 145]AHA56008.1 hypothetical protein EhV164_00421 [Emiliania huxleyi virus 164]CAI65812.1 hypothetical protein EhV385 [Emiliania huxleyi virus 86]
MKLPGSLIKKRATAVEKYNKTHKLPTDTRKSVSVPTPSPIHSPVAMSAAPAEIKYIDSTVESMSKITPVVNMMMSKLEQLEKKHSPEPVRVTNTSPIVDAVVPVDVPAVVPAAVPAVVPEPPIPELTEADLQKKSKPELMGMCSTNKVYVKLPATRKVLIAAILNQQKLNSNHKDTEN